MANKKFLTDEEKALIIRLKKEGYSAKEIEKQTGRGHTTIHNVLLREGLITSDILTEEQKQKILELKEQGLNCVEIGKQIGRANKTVSAFLVRNGISSEQKIENKLSEKVLNDICEAYKNGESAATIKKRFSLDNVSERAILKHCNEHGIKPRPTGKFANIKNEDFFETIDTEEKAYILGLLITDGYVIYPNRDTPHNPHWGITLKTEDKYVLERIKELVGCNVKIIDRERNRTGMKTSTTYESQLIVCSRKMVEDLSKYSVTQRKTYTAEIPIIRQDLMPHLIRGIFDGDGCISSNRISFAGNIKVLSALQKYLEEKIQINKTKIWGREHVSKANEKTTCYKFSFSRKQDVTNFYHLIYDNATIYLSRKKDKFVIE